MLDWPVHPRLRRPVSVWSAMRTMWSSTARPRLADRQSKNQGPLWQGFPPFPGKARRPAIRPFEASKAVVCDVRNTSTPAIRRPMTKVIDSLRRQPQRPNFLKDTPKIFFRREAHGSISVQEGQPFPQTAKTRPLISSIALRNSGLGSRQRVL